MASPYKDWEDKLRALKMAFDKELADIRLAKQELFNEQSDKQQKLPGKLIQDDTRIIISAPEIIIGNVNMGGMLDSGGDSNLIIRGNHVFLEGVGNSGQLSMRAPTISQIAEDPGIDGEEHVVCATSKIINQACEITLESNTVPENGIFLEPDATNSGSISIRADKDIKIDALKSKDTLANKAKIKADECGTYVANHDVDADVAVFNNLRTEIDDLLEKRRKLITDDDNAIRTDYRDLDELNIRIDELSLDLAWKLSTYYKNIARLAENKRQNKYFSQLHTKLNNIKDFDKNPTDTSVSINSEQINMSSVDGDGNRRINEGAGMKFNANNVRFDGMYTDKDELVENNKFSVNMRTFQVTSESKTNKQCDESNQIKRCDYPSVGNVVIRSKDILIENTDYELADKKYKEKGLTADGSINLRSKTINLSTVNSSDMEVDDKGNITKATYKSEGDVNIYSKNVTMKSVDGKRENGKYEEGALTKDSSFIIRAENFAFSATDQEGKASGAVSINAKDITIHSADVDPKSGKIKQIADGGSVTVAGESITFFSTQTYAAYSGHLMELHSNENALLKGDKRIEVVQDNNFLNLEGGNAELSGSKNKIYGETTVNVLNSPSITVDNLTASKAIKAPNISDGVMIDAKNSSTSSPKQKPNDPPKPEKEAPDKVRADEGKDPIESGMLAEFWKEVEEEIIGDN